MYFNNPSELYDNNRRLKYTMNVIRGILRNFIDRFGLACVHVEVRVLSPWGRL